MSKMITFVTGNKNKLLEVQHILAKDETNPLSFTLESKKLDLPEYQGTSKFIATEKCKIAATLVNGPVITEDTSLCFNAMNSLPGPYIKWFLDSLGHEGLNKMLMGFEDKSAYALCTFAFCEGVGKEVLLFEGKTDGKIVLPRGSNFGWDPIFEPDEGEGLTFGEMEKEKKNLISHRFKALYKLKEHLRKL
ncbi:hypothetical protein HDU92_007188 [Lobulomyces angularis]|nr:hypothetical protein HDU92_007188 [Lobulomyces angularis]